MNKPLITLAALFTFGGLSLADTAPANSTKAVKQSVAESLTGHTRVLRDGALALTDINKNVDYYFVYYSASW
jgi:hypothetical protein